MADKIIELVRCLQPCIFVGLGGASGAVCRYLFSLIPIQGSFPAATLLTNLFGAVLIGGIVGAAALFPQLSPGWLLFLKTGFCGGFTTFSTFSLETLTLLETGKTLEGTLYAVASVALCILGTAVGKSAANFFVQG